MEKEEIDKIIQENIILKADNLLFREDLIHLSETNKNLVNEIDNLQRKILGLLNQNGAYQKEIANKMNTIDQLNKSIEQINIASNLAKANIARHSKQTIEEKVYSLMKENQNLNNELVRLNTENKLLNDRIIELKSQNEQYIKSQSLSKAIEHEQLSNLEEKIVFLENTVQQVNNQNNQLRAINDKNRNEINALIKEKEAINNKYHNKKDEFNKLMLSYQNLENQMKQMEIEKIEKENNEKILEKTKNFEKNDKKQIFSDLYQKIQKYKNKIKNSREPSPFYTEIENDFEIKMKEKN